MQVLDRLNEVRLANHDSDIVQLVDGRHVPGKRHSGHTHMLPPARTVERAPAANDENIVVILRRVASRLFRASGAPARHRLVLAAWSSELPNERGVGVPFVLRHAFNAGTSLTCRTAHAGRL